MRSDRVSKLVAGALALGTLALSTGASAYCRTTTCSSTDGTCTLDPTTGCATNGIPLFWPSRCVSFDLEQNASSKVSIEAATVAADSAFATWQSANCGAGPAGSGGDAGAPIDGGTTVEASTPSIRFSDFGPVVCDRHEYNAAQGNANVIVFRDRAWPYTSASNALALTTVTFNVDTGEIYDADMELNGTADITTDPASPRYDLQSIVTHEAGHFLGLSHSPDASATMFRTYAGGTTSLRSLSQDDVDGVCAIYPPAAAGGACDPTPRHGFSTTCAIVPDSKSGCSVGSGATGARPREAAGVALGALASAFVAALRRRARRRGDA